MKILLTGGGTGGHIYPAVALAERLLKTEHEVVYIGRHGGLEERLVPAAGIALRLVHAAPLPRKLSGALLTTLGKNLAGLSEALRIIQAFRPDAVVATGGYVAFPVMAAAWIANGFRAKHARAMLGLLEPNAVAGLTNRLLAPLVDEIWGSFPQSAGRHPERFFCTGTPVREVYLHPPERTAAALSLGLDPARTTILVIGGSQGAHSFNVALAELFARPLPQPWQILQVSGTEGFAEAQTHATAAMARGEAKIFDYLENPIAAYAAADLVVARAGASTLAELAALGKPALLVPYPFATDDHQRKNAEAFLERGAGRMLLDAELHGASLLEVLQDVLRPDVLHALTLAAQKSVAEDAAITILTRILSSS